MSHVSHDPAVYQGVAHNVSIMIAAVIFLCDVYPDSDQNWIFYKFLKLLKIWAKDPVL